MKVINIQYDIPYYNFALEEYLLEQAPSDDYLFFYIHRPAIIVGKHQNTLEEINEKYVQEKNIQVARRMSGGGAVYHDEGNLNFSFVKPGKATDVNDFVSFTKPIVEVLQQLGAPAELSGRNDLTVDGFKVSGNASCFKNDRILSHGTLLFKANMGELANALNVSDIKLKSKGIQSVRSRVANLADYLPTDLTIEDLKDAIIHHFKDKEHVEIWTPTSEERAVWEKRAEEHFATWQWNWGQSPDYNVRRVAKFPCGLIDVRLNKQENKIKQAYIYGDFFTAQDVKDLASAFTNQEWTEQALTDALKDMEISRYFANITNQEFIYFLIHNEICK